MRVMSRKKQRKQKARERRVAREKLYQADRRRYTQAFPRFVLRLNNAPEGFVDLIWRTVRGIDFRDRTLFDPADADFLRLAKRQPGEVLPALARGWKAGDLLAVHLGSFVGRAVFASIPADQLRLWIPFHHVQFALAGGEIVVEFRSLEKAKGPGATVYYSPHRPTLEVGGDKKIVGWSRHAIERTCDRLAPRWESYLGLGDMFAFFHSCWHYERADLHGGQFAFTFYDKCAQGFFTDLFATNVLGNTDGKQCYYRVGYCPAVVEGEFVKATTLLYPGFAGTPEYGAILKARLHRKEKQRLIDLARVQSREYLEKSGDFTLVKWFHDQGVPQVVQTEEAFFAGA